MQLMGTAGIVVIFLGGIFFLTITVPFNDPNLLNAANKTARSV